MTERSSYEKHEATHSDVQVHDVEGKNAIAEHDLEVRHGPLPNTKELNKALFKLDCFFLPAVTMVYFLSFLDVGVLCLSSMLTRSVPTSVTQKLLD